MTLARSFTSSIAAQALLHRNLKSSILYGELRTALGSNPMKGVHRPQRQVRVVHNNQTHLRSRQRRTQEALTHLRKQHRNMRGVAEERNPEHRLRHLIVVDPHHGPRVPLGNRPHGQRGLPRRRQTAQDHNTSRRTNLGHPQGEGESIHTDNTKANLGHKRHVNAGSPPLRPLLADEDRMFTFLAKAPSADIPASVAHVLRALGDVRDFTRAATTTKTAKLERMSHSTKIAIALGVTWNPDVTPAMLKAVARVDDTLVKEVLARHPLTPKQTLTRLASSPHLTVRLALASRPQLPKEVRALLKKDPSLTVREALKANPADPAKARAATLH